MTLAFEPGPVRRVSIRTLPRAEPKPRQTQSSEASRSISAFCEAKTQLPSPRPWAVTYRRLAPGPTKISVTELKRPRRSWSVVSHCSHTSASAPSSRTINVRKPIAIPSPSWMAAIWAGSGRLLPFGT